MKTIVILIAIERLIVVFNGGDVKNMCEQKHDRVWKNMTRWKEDKYLVDESARGYIFKALKNYIKM